MKKCDYKNCKNKAYKEVYYVNNKKNILGGKMHWSYLCRKHFKQEKNKQIGWCSV